MRERDMTLLAEDTGLRQAALAYVSALYREVTGENGAPTLGTVNQAVEFILADSELRRGVAQWAARENIDEAATAPPRRLQQDGVYDRVSAFLEDIMEEPVFERAATQRP